MWTASLIQSVQPVTVRTSADSCLQNSRMESALYRVSVLLLWSLTEEACLRCMHDCNDLVYVCVSP